MKSKTYFSQDLQHKVLSKRRTFAAHFNHFSGTQLGKHCLRGNTDEDLPFAFSFNSVALESLLGSFD